MEYLIEINERTEDAIKKALDLEDDKELDSSDIELFIDVVLDNFL